MDSIGFVLFAVLGITSVALIARAAIRRSRASRLEEYRETLPLLHAMVFESGRPADHPLAEIDRDRLMEAVRRRAVTIVTRWDDRDIGDIALFVGSVWLDGEVPFDDIVAFLREERDAVRGEPGLVGLHIWRLARRFGPSPERG